MTLGDRLVFIRLLSKCQLNKIYIVNVPVMSFKIVLSLLKKKKLEWENGSYMNVCTSGTPTTLVQSILLEYQNTDYFSPTLNLSGMCARGLRRDEGAVSVRITHPPCEHTACPSERPAPTLTECGNNPCLCATNCSGVCVLLYTWLSTMACSNVGICLHFHLPTEWL